MKPLRNSSNSSHVWERDQYIWSVFNGFFLCILAGMMFSRGMAGEVWLRFSFCLIWFAGLFILDLKSTRGDRPLHVIYMLIGIGLWTYLTMLDPMFTSIMGLLFPTVFRILPFGWGAIMSGLICTIWGLMNWQRFSGSWQSSLTNAVIFYFAGLTLAYFFYRIIVQSRARQILVETLEKTRRDLAEAEHRAGRYEERRRIAGELHDTIAQKFTSVVTHLEAAEAVMDQAKDSMAGYLNQAKQAAREGLAQTRDRVWALRPDLDQDLPLNAALRRIGETWAREKSMNFEFHTTGVPRQLKPDQIELLLRCARECLLNIYKHAATDTAVMTVSFMDDMCALDVLDHGKGMDLQEPAGGYGLVAMRHAVERAGGSLVIESALGEGMAVAVSIPIEAESEDHERDS